MESENETRPLLPSIDNESWRSRTRRRCLRIPSEITITGIILGLFLIVVTLLIVLENVESEKKEELTLDDNLLASPFKYNKKVEDQSWQGDKKADKSWQDAKEMKLKNKEQKWDKVNKGFKVSPILSASPFKYNKKIEDQSWQDDKKADKSWQDAKEMKLKNKEQKWDKVNKGFKVSPILSASPLTSDKNVEDPSWQPKSWQEWKQMKLKNRLLKWEKFNNGFKTFPILSASPFTYDKNVEDPSWEPKSWQEWKQMKLKNKLLKWEKFNKGFKTFPILSGETANLVDEENDTVKNLGISAFEDYGKEIDDDDSLETHVELQMSDPSDFRKFKEDVLEIQNMLHSNTKWSLIDEGWKTLSDQGWKEWEIRRALSKALKEKRRQLNSEYNVLQSPTNFGQIWDNIIEHWKKNKDEGKEIADNQKMIGDKEAEHQKNINDDLINEMNILQSPKSDIKNYLKDDAGWQKLTEQGWKNKAIVESLINAWKEQQNASLLQSPMNIESLFGKATDFFKSIFEKGTGEQNSQMAINDEWAKKFNNLQSPMFSSKKFGKTNEEKKKHSKDDWKDKITKTIANETDQILQSSMNFEDLTLERIIEAIKEHKKDNEEAENQIDINEDTKNDPKISYSSTQFDNKWKQVDDHWKQFIEYGLKDKNIKEAIDKAWKDSNKLLQSSVGINNYKWKKVDNGWKTISNKSMIAPTGCPFSKIFRQFSLSSVMSEPPINCALITEEVRQKFGKCIDLSFLPKACKPSWREKCLSNYKYRTQDGTCNNKIHPTWGKSGTPYVRMLAPDYADGVSALRAAKDGEPLPNPRFLSWKLYSKRIKPESDTSVLFLYFGLLIDHDLVETSVNSNIPCCREDFKIHPQNRPKECLQIDIPSDDPFYGPKNVNCLNLVRSLPVNGDCGGRREQLNKGTSFLDGSVVYGSTVDHTKQLRAFSKGQLKTSIINNTPFMAYAEGSGLNCGRPTEPLKCFDAGDSRVNMMVELTAMHTLWYREHNRISTELHKINPHWSDEILFQEARRIIIGELQHIAYNEFLPVLLGQKALEDYELKIDESKPYDGYDETMDPSIFNVFGAAAFRFGHSIVPDTQYLLGVNHSKIGKVPLHETFFNAKLLYHDGFDLLLRGAATQRTLSVDSYLTPEVREHLFQPSDLDYGYDLAAVGIQRGRDHGLPSYVKWRSVCGLSDVNTWDDLYKVMDKERADTFKSVYESVEDIDLIPAALAEHHAIGSLVGPTYTCLIGRQFQKTRKSDRFWFEKQNETGSFTKSQLNEIYKSNIARIVCDNSDGMKTVQSHPFKVPSVNNPILDCDAIPKLDLSDWRSNN